jgi:hypothetical protein
MFLLCGRCQIAGRVCESAGFWRVETWPRLTGDQALELACLYSNKAPNGALYEWHSHRMMERNLIIHECFLSAFVSLLLDMFIRNIENRKKMGVSDMSFNTAIDLSL